MSKLLQVERDGEIAVLILNNPPVNSLSQAMRRAVLDAFQQVHSDTSVRAIVLIGSGKLFCGGADITEFAAGTFADEPQLPDLVRDLETSEKLVVAALNGPALGGGLELALGADYRMIHPAATVGLPEVNLGILPGAGGTQRVPRLAGAEWTLNLITSGQPINAEAAVASGLVDRLADNTDFQQQALAYARELLSNGAPLRDCAAMEVAETSDQLFAQSRQKINKKKNGFYAPLKCVEAVEAAVNLSLIQGLKKEQKLFSECIETPQARAQQHLFFAERAVGRIPGIDPKTPPRKIERVGVIGAGTMGGGIAMNFANVGIPVRLLELKPEALERGVATIRKNYEISAAKGRISAGQLEQRMELLQGTLDYEALVDCDLVIEAVFENMDIKQQVFRKLDAVCKPRAILASNTSTLDVDAIAAVTNRPQDVIGLHFFSPANVMRLLEIVRGKATADDVVVTAMQMGRTIKKMPVVVGVCFGFVGNRMLEPYLREGMRLILEGASPRQVDEALTEFGMAMGVISMIDLAGNDVSFSVREARREEIACDPGYQILSDRLYAMGRYGQKTGRGFYRYAGREKQDDLDVLQMAQALANELGIKQREISNQEIVERCLFTLINEGAQILDEEIAYRASDCDLIWVNGYGFPVWRGGPMQYADEIGLDVVLSTLNCYREQLGGYGEMWFKPAPLLERLVREGKTFKQFDQSPE